MFFSRRRDYRGGKWDYRLRDISAVSAISPRSPRYRGELSDTSKCLSKGVPRRGIAQGPSESHLRKILYIGYILVEE
jgi:hypothetical protein